MLLFAAIALYNTGSPDFSLLSSRLSVFPGSFGLLLAIVLDGNFQVVSNTQGLHCMCSGSCSICFLMASNNFDIGSLPMRNPSNAMKVSLETPFVNKSDMLYLVFT